MIMIKYERKAPEAETNNSETTEKEPYYLLPIPCKTLESFAGKIDSSLRETCDRLQQRTTQLEAQLGQALERLDEAQAELVALRDQRNRAAAALGLGWTGMGVQQ